MRNFLFKLFSINWKLFKTSKEKHRSRSILDAKKSIAQRKIVSLERSTVESCHPRIVKSAEWNNQLDQQPLPMLTMERNSFANCENLGKTSHAMRDDQSSTSSLTSTKDEFHLLPFDTGPSTKELYNEMNIRELVNTVRSEIGELIDADRGHAQNINTSAAKKKKSKKKKVIKKPVESKQTISESTEKTASHDQCNQCCCNFLHYSLRQIMRDSEQIKQFAMNTAMIGLDPSKLRDPTNTLCPAICLPMYNCEYIGDQRFPMGPTFTTISKNEINQLDDHSNEHRIDDMVIQTIHTHRGPIQIRLDPQSFGLSPFFSDQYESFIKGPPTSIFFNSYVNTYHDGYQHSKKT